MNAPRRPSSACSHDRGLGACACRSRASPGARPTIRRTAGTVGRSPRRRAHRRAPAAQGGADRPRRRRQNAAGAVRASRQAERPSERYPACARSSPLLHEHPTTAAAHLVRRGRARRRHIEHPAGGRERTACPNRIGSAEAPRIATILVTGASGTRRAVAGAPDERAVRGLVRRRAGLPSCAARPGRPRGDGVEPAPRAGKIVHCAAHPAAARDRFRRVNAPARTRCSTPPSDGGVAESSVSSIAATDGRARSVVGPSSATNPPGCATTGGSNPRPTAGSTSPPRGLPTPYAAASSTGAAIHRAHARAGRWLRVVFRRRGCGPAVHLGRRVPGRTRPYRRPRTWWPDTRPMLASPRAGDGARRSPPMAPHPRRSRRASSRFRVPTGTRVLARVGGAEVSPTSCGAASRLDAARHRRTACD